MTEEEPPLPLARMATINKPSFWIFIGACILLYIYNKIVAPDAGDAKPYILNSLFIFVTAFVALKNDWPQKRTYKLFTEWFDTEIHTIVEDIEEGPIRKS